MAAVMTDKQTTMAAEIAAALAAAGISMSAVERDHVMHVEVRTPAGWSGDKSILASRALQALQPGWGPEIVGSHVSVVSA